MIKPLRNVFLVSIDKEADSKITLSSGLELIIDREFGEQSTTLDQEHELYNYYRELEKEYSMLHDKWIQASKYNLPVVVDLKRRLMQIEAEQKAHKVNKIIKPFSNVIQNGIIKQTPRKVDARVRRHDKAGNVYYDGYFNDTPLEVGDKIYFHHFVCQPENEVELDGEVVYKADYNQIMCVVRDGKVIPLEKWIMATPEMETEEDIVSKVGDVIIYKKLGAEKKHLVSRIVAVNYQSAKAGYQVGDKILHPEFSEYKIKVEGQDMYRMHLDDIFCVLKG